MRDFFAGVSKATFRPVDLEATRVGAKAATLTTEARRAINLNMAKREVDDADGSNLSFTLMSLRS